MQSILGWEVGNSKIFEVRVFIAIYKRTSPTLPPRVTKIVDIP
jgi:hypothetical protein